jgi:hypothetical protein
MQSRPATVQGGAAAAAGAGSDPRAAEELRLTGLLTEQQRTTLDRMRACQQSLIASLLAKLEIGVLLKEEWLAKSAVVYVWNLHLPLFRDGGAALADMIAPLRCVCVWLCVWLCVCRAASICDRHSLFF